MRPSPVATLLVAAIAIASSVDAAATVCVPLGSTATAWDAVTPCTDVYAVFTNGDARISEDSTASVLATATTTTVATLDECATACFKQKKCQWFKVSGTTTSKTCTFYQHLAISARSTALSSSTAQYGFVLSGDPDFLNQNVDTTSGSVFKRGSYNFYTTTDLATSKTISMYIDSATRKCAAVPLTLFRTFSNNYQTASMITGVTSGTTFNSMDAAFTLDRFVASTKGTLTGGIQVTTDAVDINSKGTVYRTGEAGSTFTYKLDTFGRVADVAAKYNYTNVLKKAGRPSANSAGTTIRAQYCLAAYQSRFNVLQQLTDATSADLAFQAGHISGCQFSNPQGFFNFVPQSVNSNANNGCWYNSELGTSRMLKMGCEGTFRARMTYFSQPGDISEISSLTGPMLSASDASSLYTTTGNNKKLVVQRPCGFFYRPVKMSYDFTITGATANTRCSLVQDVVKDNGGKIFTTDPKTANVVITRAFAQWMYETNSFFRVRGLGVADWRVNQCYAETGDLAPTMTFGNELDRVFLKLKDTATTPTCVSVTSASSGTLKAGACDLTGKLSRWSAPASTLALTSGAGATCVTASASSKACLNLSFQYSLSSVTFSSSTSKANVASGDDLVDGFIVSGSTCLVLSSTNAISFVSMSTSTASCTVFQATYTLDTGAIEGDD